MHDAPFFSDLEKLVKERFDEQIEFLAQLVRIPTDNPPGDCAPAAVALQRELEALGLEVSAYPIGADECHRYGMRSLTNIIVRHRFSPAGPVVALNAHGDVVAPGDGWEHDPYSATIIDVPGFGPTMYGRGVAVSKSDIATYTWALLALRAAAQNHPLCGSVELHFTYDEEAGGELGPKWILENGLSHPDFAISAGFSYAVVTAHNGCLHLEVTVTGRQAHAAHPQDGHDALEAATIILQSLYDFRATLAQGRSRIIGIGAPTLNIGLIEGGINTNVVPDSVRFRIDRRVIPDEQMDDAEAEMIALIQSVGNDSIGISTDVRAIMRAAPLTEVDGSDRLAGIIQTQAQRIFHTPVEQVGVPLYTDARHYAATGIPTVLYGAGPRTIQQAKGHAANEQLVLQDLSRATCVIACALAELLSVKK